MWKVKTLGIFCFSIILLIHLDCIAPAIIRNTPGNVTALSGSDVRFICEVIEKRASDIVFWKKVSPSGFTDVISYDQNVILNVTKYTIDRFYSLHIRRIKLEDESWYECQAGVDRARALLNVTVMMNNMTLTWGEDPPFQADMFVNLTCSSFHSRPPADLHWLYGQDDITSLASTCSKTFEDGFGDSVSTLLAVVRADLIPYRCVASLPGISVARTEVVFPRVDGQTSGGGFTMCHSLVPAMFAVFCLTL